MAATYNVDTELDPLMPDCTHGSGLCSLREAIRLSNGTPDTFDIIYLPAGHFQLQRVGRNEDLNATGDLDLLDGLAIVGAGALETVIDARGIDRVFDLRHEGEQSLISGVTVTGGDVDGGGGGIRVYSSALHLSYGRVIGNRALLGPGGIYLYQSSMGTFIQDSLIAENTGCPAGVAFWIPGISTLSIFRSSIIRNRSLGLGCGHGLYLTDCPGAELTKVHSSTIAQNDDSGVESYGCDLEIRESTIVDNNTSQSTAAAGLGVFNIGTRDPTVDVYGSILANQRATDCSFSGTILGNVTHGGGNLDDDGSCGLDPVQDLPMTAPQLLRLGAFPALAPSYHPDRTSPVIDFNGSCLATDQDGFDRPQDPDGGDIGCDVGSIEVLDCSIAIWNTLRENETITSGEIEACESVVANDVTIDGDVNFSARYLIYLGNGFKVLDGSSFVARLARDVGYVAP